jgi:hypothetical protein
LELGHAVVARGGGQRREVGVAALKCQDQTKRNIELFA